MFAPVIRGETIYTSLTLHKDIEELRSDIEKTRPPQPQNKEFLDKLLQSAADIDKMMSQHLQQNKKQKGKH